MTSCFRWTACLVMSLMLSGCAVNDLMVKRQSEAEAKIEHLIQAGQKAEQHLNEIYAQAQLRDDHAKGAAVLVKQLQTDIHELKVAHEELKARVTLLARQSATPKIEVVNQEPAQKGKDSGPPAEYVKAFGLYSANRFPDAIEAFEIFIKKNPQSEFTANAMYWIGECHYSMTDFARALSIFQKVVDDYPKSGKAPDAMLKTGYTLIALKNRDKAVATFEKLIKSYPAARRRARPGSG